MSCRKYVRKPAGNLVGGCNTRSSFVMNIKFQPKIFLRVFMCLWFHVCFMWFSSTRRQVLYPGESQGSSPLRIRAIRNQSGRRNQSLRGPPLLRRSSGWSSGGGHSSPERVMLGTRRKDCTFTHCKTEGSCVPLGWLPRVYVQGV